MTPRIPYHCIQAYARLAIKEPQQCKIVAVAEPRPKTRERMITTHNVSPSLTFNNFEEFLAASAASIAKGETDTLSGKGRLADAVVVAVHDRQHKDVVIPLAAQGYHILCEKPMATSAEDCIEMVDAMKKSGKIMGIGHGSYYKLISQLGISPIFEFVVQSGPCSSPLFALFPRDSKGYRIRGTW